MNKKLHPDKHFFSVDGKQIGSIPGLIDALKSMDNVNFSHHVNSEKNDFSAWIKGCFGEQKLAAGIKNAKSKQEMIDILKAHQNTEEKPKKRKRTVKPTNLLVSGNLKEKIKWYIKAHGHSCIGGLNLIWTLFSFNGRKETADIIDNAIKLFENFADSDDLKQQLKNLKAAIADVVKAVSREEMQDEKREETMKILSEVKKNVSRINNIIKNPGYEERFKLSKILFSTAVQLLKHYPNMLYGDFIGNKGDDIGNRIKLNVNPSQEEEILCCGYEMQLLLFNLLSNAVEAIKEKGSIYVAIKYENDNAIIEVSDDGELISEEDIKKIKNHGEFSTKGREHGLGLKIVTDILEKYDGSLDVRSDDSKSLVTFSVRIPIKSGK